jgi:hypothetical protein
MAVKVRLFSQGQITSREDRVTDNGDLLVSRAIYQRLGSLVNAKTILEDYNNGDLPKEFVAFMERMEANVDVTEVDTYLGSLGFGEEYFYSKDIVDIPLWIAPMTQEAVRSVAYIVDGVTVDNIVDGIDNLVHLTGV